MTWAKFGDEYCGQLARADVSDAAFRTHTEGIAWLYRVEATDLRIPKRLLRHIAVSEQYETAVKELEAVRFWKDRGDAWEVVHQADVIRQSIAAQRAKKLRDRSAQRASRSRKAAPEVSGGVSADISTDVSGDTDRQAGFPRGRQVLAGNDR